MMHPATRLGFVSEAQGFGVFATAVIPAGTLTWVRDEWDIVIPAVVPADLLGTVERYAYTEADGTVLMPWDHGRYVNHACKPNCAGLQAGIDLAVRDIQPGEQLTNDYSVLGTFEQFPCACGSPNCRKTVEPRAVDAELLGAFEAARALMATVPQPLGERAVRWLEAERPQARKSSPGRTPRVMSGRLNLR
ncbi:MAG: SET domain-containing protein [Alphaproteobacteria bacterium]|nr:SET domain-containing protein [Alphaproteobacteria bacterium]MCB9692323.1 SET domain-containing protein [Alphaproteobacteria bacterium]